MLLLTSAPLMVYLAPMYEDRPPKLLLQGGLAGGLLILGLFFSAPKDGKFLIVMAGAWLLGVLARSAGLWARGRAWPVGRGPEAAGAAIAAIPLAVTLVQMV